MFGAECFGFSLWWILPVVMIIICFLMMRGRMGSMMCAHGSQGTDNSQTSASDSVMEILDKRYAQGEIDRDEYEERKRNLLDNNLN
jgi:putative membrane protein